jgi:hypothetical protein
MDSNALYGYMIGGGLLMAAAIAMLTAFLPMEGVAKYVSLGIFFVIAYGIHLGFLTWLQAESCSGVKSFRAIAIGAFLGTLFVAGCVAIPLHMDWARLAFSDLIRTHYAMLTPEVTAFARKFVSVMRQQGGATEVDPSAGLTKSETPDNSGPSKSIVSDPSKIFALQNLLDEELYKKQTTNELAISTPFWAFLAGAVGIGFGNLFSGSACT